MAFIYNLLNSIVTEFRRQCKICGQHCENTKDKMGIFIDMCCLKGRDGKLIIKELSCVNSKIDGPSHAVQTFLFKPPHPFELLPPHIVRSNQWVTTNMHGIRWSDGYIPYSELAGILCKVAKKRAPIYVKGEEKCNLLRDVFRSRNEHAYIFDLDRMSCPKHASLPLTHNTRITCMFKNHPKNGECAQVKALKYADWVYGRSTRKDNKRRHQQRQQQIAEVPQSEKVPQQPE